MIRSETRLTSHTFSIHLSATNTPTPAVPLLFPDQNSLYLESLPLIIRQWPPRYLVSWTQQRSTFLRDSVSTTSQTLPFRVFTLRVPTLKFLRCLLDSPQWPDPAPPPERCTENYFFFFQGKYTNKDKWFNPRRSILKGINWFNPWV